MRITIDNLKHFQAVVRFQNLNLASEKINISPSAVSRSIKIIEDDLGYPLFSRIGRNIVLNSEGARFYEKSLALIENYESLYNESYPSELSGTYKIGASHWLAGKFLPSRLEILTRENDALKFEVFSLDSHLAVLKILSGDLDLALCFSPKSHPEINSHEIHSGRLVLCGGKGHPLLKLKSRAVLKEINRYEAIIHKANDLILSCDDHPMFIQYNIKPRFKFYWDSDFSAIEFLKTDRYWSMLPDIVVDCEKDIFPFEHPSKWDAPYSIQLLAHKDRPKHLVEKILNSFLSSP